MQEMAKPSFLSGTTQWFFFFLLYWERKRNLFWWHQQGMWEVRKQKWDFGDLECNPTVIPCVCSAKSLDAPSLCFSSSCSVQTLLFCECFCWHQGVWSMLGLLDSTGTNFHWMKKVVLFVFLFKWSVMLVRTQALESSPVICSDLRKYFTVVAHLKSCSCWALMSVG